MDKKWVLSKLFLSIDGKIIGLLASEKSANSENNILQSMNFLRNLPIFQQPISNKQMIFPMMTIVEHSTSRLSTKIISIKPTFYYLLRRPYSP
jgi:hypothetical protein